MTTIPPFDPELAPILAASPIPSTITADMIPVLRSVPFTPPIADLVAGRPIEHRDIEIEGPGGGRITLAVIRPTERTPDAPVILYLHGGGMIIGDRFTGIAPVLDWVETHGVVAVSVEYRLAPEHPAPAGVEDAYAALQWIADQASELGIDARRVIVAGTSAGGGIAASTVLRARDAGGPAVHGQLLMSPMLDDRDETLSTLQYADTGSWTRVSNTTGWSALLGDRRGGPQVTSDDAAARATDLTGLPSTFIDVGSAEVFRDEDTAYANSLWEAGIDTELHVWAGGFHIFDGIAPDAQISRATVKARHTWLRRILSR
ncbi:alpha/beta hydrolase [Promicromonospora sp. NPDC090134]|uniref:alpha/beta hydrolase n=1 Tax=Promicromonospora sp. NPDC090134 TaxID=3364408 RepID=UPI003800F0B2